MTDGYSPSLDLDRQLIENRRQKVVSIIIIVLIILLTVFLLCVREHIQHLGSLGYPGIFLVSVLTNATLIVPMPTIILTSALGAIFNPFWVAIAAGSGAAIGEISGFLAGASGRNVITNIKHHKRLNHLVSGKSGGFVIFLLALIPNPLFDVAGMVAGAYKMPFLKFITWCWLGKVIKMLIFSYGGAALLRIHP